MSLLKPTAEEQEMRESLARFFSAEVTTEYLRKRVSSQESSDLALFRKLTELGVFDLVSAEGAGDFAQLAVIAFESARVVCPENIVDNLYFGPFLAKKLEALLGPEIASQVSVGDKRVVGALIEAGAIAQSMDATLRLVAGVDVADYVLLIDPNGAGYLSPKPTKMALEISLDETIKKFSCIINGSSIRELGNLSKARLGLFVLRAAELAGVTDKAVAMTSEYVKMRKQFDRAIGSFQAVQHKLADMYLKSQSMRALAFFAAWAYEHSPDQEGLAALSALRYAVSNASAVVESAIQLHGGIGFTWEYDLQFYLRRAKSIEAIYGGQFNDQEILRAA